MSVPLRAAAPLASYPLRPTPMGDEATGQLLEVLGPVERVLLQEVLAVGKTAVADRHVVDQQLGPSPALANLDVVPFGLLPFPVHGSLLVGACTDTVPTCLSREPARWSR